MPQGEVYVLLRGCFTEEKDMRQDHVRAYIARGQPQLEGGDKTSTAPARKAHVS